MSKKMLRLQWLCSMMMAIALLCGCATIPSSFDSSEEEQPVQFAETPPQPDAEGAQAINGPHYRIEMRPIDGGKPERVQVPHQGTVFLQDALDHVRAREKFRGMEIVVFRCDPRTGRSQRMGAKYDSEKREIAMEYDYALHPGDIVLITETPENALDQVLGKFSVLRGRTLR